MDRRAAAEQRRDAARPRAGRAPGVPLGPNPRVGCVLLAADGTTVAEGFHRGAGTPHAEVGRPDPGRRPGPGHDRRRHPRALQPHRPHRARAPRRSSRRASPGWSSRRPTPTRSPPGGADALRAGRRRRRGRAAGRRGARPQPGLDLRRRARPAVRHLEARHHPRRPQRRRRRHLAVGQLGARPPRHPPAARAVRRDPGRHRHRAGRRPAAHRPRRRRRRRCPASGSRCAR